MQATNTPVLTTGQTTAAATAAKAVALSDYALTVGGVVAVKFTYDVPASSTLNVNSKGAKAIYHRGAAITANIIKAGDTVTFIYDGTNYHLLTINRIYNAMTANDLGLGKPVGYYYQSTATYNGSTFGGSTSPIDTSAVKTVDINSLTTTAGRYYGIEADKEGRLFVNVPWVSGGSYSLPTASSTEKGGIKVGTGLSMSSETMNLAGHATTATTYGLGTISNYGHVKIQNGDLHTQAHVDGVAAGLAHTHTLYAFTSDLETLDQAKQDKLVSGTNIKTINGTSILGSGNISVSADYTLPTASSSTKGGIKVGTGLSISSEKLSVSYGTSSTTAAVGNDSRFGKVGVSEAEYRAEDTNPAISYYKLGLINSGQSESNKGNDLSVTSANLVYNSE